MLFYTKQTCLLTQTSLINESRLLAQSPRIRNPLRCLLIRVACPISMCLRMQACSVTWLLSGTFKVKNSPNNRTVLYFYWNNPLIVRFLAQVGTFLTHIHLGVAVASQILCISTTLNKRLSFMKFTATHTIYLSYQNVKSNFREKLSPAAFSSPIHKYSQKRTGHPHRPVLPSIILQNDPLFIFSSFS